MWDIEELHAARVGDLRRVLARHAEADVILRQEDVAATTIVLRLMVADPENLRGREARQSRIRRDLDEALAADALRDFFALLARALVAPDDGRADDLIVRIEHDEAVHLPREADALDVLWVDTRFLDDITNRFFHGMIPISRFLLCPTILWLIEWIFL